MKCPKCEKELQPNWQICPSCGTKITAVRICSNCKKEIESGSISCPYCGFATEETPGLSASIKDSVIKEIHQTQNIYNEARPLGTSEYQYEKYVLAVLESGGSLERARAQLEQRREQLGLSLKQSKEVEQHCLALNKNEAAPLKSEETQNQRITANISSGNSISKVTGQNRLPKWGILVGCVTLLIIGTVVFINNKHTPDGVPSVTSAQNTTSSQVSQLEISTSVGTPLVTGTTAISSTAIVEINQQTPTVTSTMTQYANPEYVVKVLPQWTVNSANAKDITVNSPNDPNTYVRVITANNPVTSLDSYLSSCVSLF
jgi:RNA polymerase subunit RPABC4/transcription elongation factor Spt4